MINRTEEERRADQERSDFSRSLRTRWDLIRGAKVTIAQEVSRHPALQRKIEQVAERFGQQKKN